MKFPELKMRRVDVVGYRYRPKQRETKKSADWIGKISPDWMKFGVGKTLI